MKIEVTSDKELALKRRKIMWCCVCIVLIGVITIIGLRLPLIENHMRKIAQKYVSCKVTKKENELFNLIGKYTDEGKNIYIHYNDENENVVPYKKLNDEEITAVFKEFHLICIRYDEKGNVVFTIYPYMELLIDGYENGFFYSKEDKPIEGENLEFEKEDAWTYQWYRTEKIIDNWWYYEEIFLLKK